MSNSNDFVFIDEVKEARNGACYCLAVRQASRRLMRLYDDKLSQHGLTTGQFAILCYISDPESHTVQTLADFLDMNQSALSRGLAPLESQGFLTSNNDPGDGRKRVLKITSLGAERINEASKSWKAAQQEIAAQNIELDINSLMQTIGILSSE